MKGEPITGMKSVGLLRNSRNWQEKTWIQGKLAQSIELLKSIRQKIWEIYTLQAKENSPVTWREVSEVIQAGYYLDRDQYLRLLDQVLIEINEEFRASTTVPKSDDRPRIILSGSRSRREITRSST